MKKTPHRDATTRLRELLTQRILVLDGAMGTQLQARDLTAADFGGAAYEGCNEYLNLTRPDVVRADNVSRLKARLMPQGANIPCTLEAEEALHQRGILIVPDSIANAGGVICASIEYRGGTQVAAFDYIDERIRANTKSVLEETRRTGALPRAAAQTLAERRVRAAMATRRWR